MLALADDAALARLVIAATRIPHRARRMRVCYLVGIVNYRRGQ